MTRRVRRQRQRRRRPGPLVDASCTSSARAAARRRSIATGKNGAVVYAANVRVGNNISSVDEMLQPGDAGSEHPGDADEQRCCSPARSPRPTTSRKRQRLVQAYVGEGTQVRQPPALGDSAAGQPQGPHRRGQPLAAQADRRQPPRPATRPAASSSASHRASGIYLPTPVRTTTAAEPRSFATPIGSTIAGGRQAVRPRPHRRRSIWPKSTAWSPRSPSRT